MVGTIAMIADAFAVLATLDRKGMAYFNHSGDVVSVGNIDADDVTEADIERLEGLGWTYTTSKYYGQTLYAFSFTY